MSVFDWPAGHHATPPYIWGPFMKSHRGRSQINFFIYFVFLSGCCWTPHTTLPWHLRPLATKNNLGSPVPWEWWLIGLGGAMKATHCSGSALSLFVKVFLFITAVTNGDFARGSAWRRILNIWTCSRFFPLQKYTHHHLNHYFFFYETRLGVKKAD